MASNKLSFLCSHGHIVKAENSSVNFDSMCAACKRIEKRAEERRKKFEMKPNMALRSASLRRKPAPKPRTTQRRVSSDRRPT